MFEIKEILQTIKHCYQYEITQIKDVLSPIPVGLRTLGRNDLFMTFS